MNKLTQKIIDELNQQYGCSFFAFSEKGLTIKFSDELKEFFDEYDIKSEMDFSDHFGSFRSKQLLKQLRSFLKAQKFHRLY